MPKNMLQLHLRKIISLHVPYISNFILQQEWHIYINVYFRFYVVPLSLLYLHENEG